MVGIALGVAALIIVLSVMNGFQKEVRDRMLSVVAHVEVYDASGQALPDWQATAARAREQPAGGRRGAVHRRAGADRARRGHARRDRARHLAGRRGHVTDLAARLRDTTLARLVPGQWGIVLGGELARSLGRAQRAIR